MLYELEKPALYAHTANPHLLDYGAFSPEPSRAIVSKAQKVDERRRMIIKNNNNCKSAVRLRARVRKIAPANCPFCIYIFKAYNLMALLLGIAFDAVKYQSQ